MKLFNNLYRSSDWKAGENEVDILFFCADIAHPIHMQIDTGRLWQHGKKQLEKKTKKQLKTKQKKPSLHILLTTMCYCIEN